MYSPAVQVKQAVTPAVFVTAPGEHAMQLVEPLTAVNEPGAQAEQLNMSVAEPPVTEKRPAGQLRQEEAPREFLADWPGPHLTH